MTINCAIIDDEPLAAGLLESYVAKTPYLNLTGTYNSAITAMRDLRDNPVPLLFLDIQMPELSGVEFAKILPKDTKIIFTTAFPQYALEGYKVNALDYLLKPISYEDFLRATEKAQDWYNILQKREPFSVRARNTFTRSGSIDPRNPRKSLPMLLLTAVMLIFTLIPFLRAAEATLRMFSR